MILNEIYYFVVNYHLINIYLGKVGHEGFGNVFKIEF
jgi:hypothetical protein